MSPYIATSPVTTRQRRVQCDVSRYIATSLRTTAPSCGDNATALRTSRRLPVHRDDVWGHRDSSGRLAPAPPAARRSPPAGRARRWRRGDDSGASSSAAGRRSSRGSRRSAPGRSRGWSRGHQPSNLARCRARILGGRGSGAGRRKVAGLEVADPPGPTGRQSPGKSNKPMRPERPARALFVGVGTVSPGSRDLSGLQIPGLEWRESLQPHCSLDSWAGEETGQGIQGVSL
jgi:hypothetical protein